MEWILRLLPIFLAEEKGLSDSTTSISYSLLFIASFSQTVTGDLSDRIGQLQVWTSLFIVILVGILSLIIVDNIIIVTLSIVVGIGFHGFRPVRDSYLMEVIPDSVGGGILGIIRQL